MGNRFTRDEQNPLANFSLDTEDRLVHATTKRQAASVVEQTQQVMSPSWQAQEKAQEQAIGGFDPQDVGEERPFVSHHSEYEQKQAQSLAHSQALAQSQDYVQDYTKDQAYTQQSAFAQGQGQTFAQGQGQTYTPGPDYAQEPAYASAQSQYLSQFQAQSTIPSLHQSQTWAQPKPQPQLQAQTQAQGYGAQILQASTEPYAQHAAYDGTYHEFKRQVNEQIGQAGYGNLEPMQDESYSADSYFAKAASADRAYNHGQASSGLSPYSLQDQDSALGQGSNQGQVQVPGQALAQDLTVASSQEAFQAQIQSQAQIKVMGLGIGQEQRQSQRQGQELGMGQGYAPTQVAAAVPLSAQASSQSYAQAYHGAQDSISVTQEQAKATNYMVAPTGAVDQGHATTNRPFNAVDVESAWNALDETGLNQGQHTLSRTSVHISESVADIGVGAGASVSTGAGGVTGYGESVNVVADTGIGAGADNSTGAVANLDYKSACGAGTDFVADTGNEARAKDALNLGGVSNFENVTGLESMPEALVGGMAYNTSQAPGYQSPGLQDQPSQAQVAQGQFSKGLFSQNQVSQSGNAQVNEATVNKAQSERSMGECVQSSNAQAESVQGANFSLENIPREGSSDVESLEDSGSSDNTLGKSQSLLSDGNASGKPQDNSQDNVQDKVHDKTPEGDAPAQGNFLYKWREARRAEKQAKLEHKEAVKAGLIPPPTKWQRFKHFCHCLFSLGWKIGVAGLCVCIGLFIYFDSVVIDEYEVDDKWVLPAVVYSRPLELYPDQRLSLEQMVYELQLLKYREVSSPRKQGEYALNKKNGRIVLIKRQFQFPEGDEPAMSVLVEFDDKRVRRILNAQTQQELGYMRMDPVLLDRINRINPQEDRIFITLDEVPKELITTLIEIEDRSYYSHMGVNPMAIARAFVKNLVAGGVVEGGSTITQQLVKNYFLTNERSYSRKLKEIFMAISMNHRYTKDQILEAYMNEIYLGQNGNAGIYGFGLASYFYFGVPVPELSLDQMALLVGLIKGPSYYDPWRHPENALERRNTVLGVLRNRGHISQERFEQESSKPLNVIARGQLNYTKTPAFMGLVKTEIGTRFKEEEERTGKDFLSGNGIRIFTSLDPQAQVAAEAAVQNEIAAIEKERKLKNLEAAMIVSSWRTGEVSAVVGSSNPKFDGYNRVLDSKRQVGSLIKPFVYLTAFHQGYHLGSIVNDTPVQVKLPNGDIWAPKNDDKRFRGPIRVIRAMASSLNVPTVRIGMGSGLDNVINTLHAAGFKRKLDMYPSIVLGTPEISPYELNSMYVGMATEGIYRDLTTLRTIVKNGEIVYQRGSNRGERTLDPKDTYLAIYGMTEATRSGTGRKIHSIFPDVTIASKTGTTNDFRDSWTVGMDSDELSTVWVGFDNNKSTGLYGSTGAMRLYIAYLKERGVNSLELNKPEGVSFVNFDKKGNVLASGCEEKGMEMFPAREDRIQFVKQCNNFGEAGYDELPYAVPNRPQQSYQPYQPYMQPGVQPNVLPQGSAQPMQPGQMWQQNQGHTPSQGPNPNQSQLTPPNQDALQSSRVEDSQARDVEPVAPDFKAKPTQSSSSNIERQADSFEDQLLGL